jgi:hypothetical protein
MSKYQIEKLLISNSVVIENIGPGCSSNFYRIDHIYDLFKYDLTFSKIKKNIFDPKRVQIISQPVDFNGEQLITSGTLEYILTIDKESRSSYDIKFERKNNEL